MENPDKAIPTLIDTLPQTGIIDWIGIRPERKSQPEVVQEVRVSVANGLEGDHYSSTSNKNRQVTLIQGEHLDGISSILGKQVQPELTRRNLVIRGINLLALRNRRFRIGSAILEGTGYCHPCSRMEENLGPGGYNAMRGHGGITARVIESGWMKLGDHVQVLEDQG